MDALTDALAGPDGTQASNAPDALAAPPPAEDALAAPLPDAEALAWVRTLSDDEPAPTVPSPGPARPARRPVLGFDDDDTPGADTVARLREERRRQALLHAEQARAAAPRPGSGISAASIIAVLVVIAFVVLLALAG